MELSEGVWECACVCVWSKQAVSGDGIHYS